MNAVIAALQNSPGHKANWLSPTHRYIGIGVSAGPSGPHGSSLYVTQVFASGFDRKPLGVRIVALDRGHE
jgi:uncharacterized protein YkwD